MCSVNFVYLSPLFSLFVLKFINPKKYYESKRILGKLQNVYLWKQVLFQREIFFINIKSVKYLQRSTLPKPGGQPSTSGIPSVGQGNK